MRFSATVVRGIVALLLAGIVSPLAGADAPRSSPPQKLEPLAREHAGRHGGRSRVIVLLRPDASAAEREGFRQQWGGTDEDLLPIIDAQVLELPNAAIEALSEHPLVERVAFDRPVFATMERTSATVGAATVREQLGYDGGGVGVAIIDSGVTSWHDDLAAPGGGQRIVRFVDVVRNRPNAYDDYGHGTHVAGIIAGNGFDSQGARAGVAPGARLTVLKVLDEQGHGRISHVIAALDYVLKHRDSLGIRVVNLSVATGVYESYWTDPLTVAVKRLVDAGIVVVAAAGNIGQTPDDLDVYGGITAPGNAPWVLTVGASSHQGTSTRRDDGMAPFSSRGPTAMDHAAKPDIVAPGVGLESLSDPDSTFYQALAPYLLPGTHPSAYLPYLSLSGTSMAAPVVTGTVALMLQANPALTPNAVKAILQYSAEAHPGHDPLTQGAGFLDAAGAVALARFFADPTGPLVVGASWSRHVIWGNQLLRGGLITPDASAWALAVPWGRARTTAGEPMTWGVRCSGDTCDPATAPRWTLSCSGDACADTAAARNVVWGLRCGGADCTERWTVAAALDQSVVWGTATDQSVVWGTAGDLSVVWGTSADMSVVWGTSCATTACEPVVWSDP